MNKYGMNCKDKMIYLVFQNFCALRCLRDVTAKVLYIELILRTRMTCIIMMQATWSFSYVV
jgi:hypothetical protein